MLKQKEMLMSLHRKLTEVIRELDEQPPSTQNTIEFETTHFRIRLQMEDKKRRFKLIRCGDEIIKLEEA